MQEQTTAQLRPRTQSLARRCSLVVAAAGHSSSPARPRNAPRLRQRRTRCGSPKLFPQICLLLGDSSTPPAQAPLKPRLALGSTLWLDPWLRFLARASCYCIALQVGLRDREYRYPFRTSMSSPSSSALTLSPSSFPLSSRAGLRRRAPGSAEWTDGGHGRARGLFADEIDRPTAPA